MGWNKGKATIVTAAAVTTVLGMGAVAGGAFVAGTKALETDKAENRIAPGVRVAGVDMGGLDREQAAERLRDWARTACSAPVTLVAPRSNKRWNVALFDAGGRFDIAGALDAAWTVGRDGGTLERLVSRARASRSSIQIQPAFQLDRDKLKRRVAELDGKVRVPARAARARMGAGGVLVVTQPERKGIRLDVDATVAALLANGPDALHDGGKAVVVVREERPAVTSDDLGAVSHLLASYSTDYSSSSSNRRHNIAQATRHIDGTLLAPGETFSYNDVVGPRTSRLGWRDAPTYQDGQVVPGPGGGVCQTSTTLYNAVLLSGMKIVRRSHHSMPVHYVPSGRDATVAWGFLDFQFQNSTDGPVYVAARASGGRLTMALYGAEPQEKKKVRIVSGERHYVPGGGFAVTTWRVMDGADGSSQREVLSTDTYRPLVSASAVRSARAPRRTRRARSRTVSPTPTLAAPSIAPRPEPTAPPA